MPTILTLKISQGTEFGTLKKNIFCLLLFFRFNGIIKNKYLGDNFQGAIFEIITFLEQYCPIFVPKK